MKRISLQMSAIKGMISDVEKLIDEEKLMTEDEHANIFKMFGQMVGVILEKKALAKEPAHKKLAKLLNNKLSDVLHVVCEVETVPVNNDGVLSYGVSIRDVTTDLQLEYHYIPVNEVFELIKED